MWDEAKLAQNVGMKKQSFVIKQVKCNVQLFIDQCTNKFPHQMKTIENGKRNICLLILDTWEKFKNKTMKCA
jgi:hypothetical protein